VEEEPLPSFLSKTPPLSLSAHQSTKPNKWPLTPTSPRPPS
jgi:hypothetical protein